MTGPAEPKLVLHYMPGTCSLASHIALEESGLAYTAVFVDRTRDQNRTAAFLAMNPLGKVPTLRFGNEVLTENPAILSYVADRVPERELLARSGTLARVRAVEWMAFLSSTVHIAYRGVFRPQVFADAPGDHAAIRAKSLDALRTALGIADRKLGGAEYAAGDAFSVADIYLMVLAGWSRRLAGEVELADYAGLARHVAAISKRPASLAAVAREAAAA